MKGVNIFKYIKNLELLRRTTDTERLKTLQNVTKNFLVKRLWNSTNLEKSLQVYKFKIFRTHEYCNGFKKIEKYSKVYSLSS